ncbi:hypothetical protein DVA67_009330 [Solirubrobacter sp. CPCC 204708]|uniref:Ig-like domain-containing protein n=1 Tax=Solirubrobacter deserti TaxID=2282478 RepID=A0ABT4RT91_9ACTN|nr:hypothetical protein [Solirubrobacter deserti]MBE2316176.1 hypothetical protein [Solirubrobacter deserti]MDA0141802.1 hypothetical protein [Solirubrobacter deserti]
MSIAGVIAAAILGVSAASASAAPVWLWACHGPAGEAIPASPASDKVETLTAGNTADGSKPSLDGCGTPGSAGVTLSVPADTPAAGSTSTLTVTLPAGLSATAAKVNGAVRGGGTFRVIPEGPAVTNPAMGSVIENLPPSNAVTLELSCTSSCATAAVDVTSVVLRVDDSVGPEGAVSWNTPVDKVMKLTPAATDQGVGLERVEVTVGNRTETAWFGNCRDLTADPATNDRRLDTTACLRGRSDGINKPLRLLEAPITVWETADGATEPDPRTLPEGMYTRTVTVYDAAGNSDVISGQVEVWHPPAPISIRTLNISTASVFEQPGNNNPNTPPGGGVQGDQATQCRTPRLSVMLDSKPVRVSKGTPVLLYKKAYRFTGRLTCVINGKRRSAPKRTKLSVLNKVGRKTVRKPNTTIRDKGRVNVKLAFVSSRTVIFRYTNAAGQKSEVKIKVRVTKKKK